MVHSHSHDALALTQRKGVSAVKRSLAALIATAVFQAVVVAFTGSAALLADTVHNILDAATAIPLWIAFWMARRKPSAGFTYGFSRLEDLAGLLVVVVIFGTSIGIAFDAVEKMRIGFVPSHIGWVAIASVIGFIGNEAVARYRIRVGREINSAALIAEAHHARVDGYTSLGVLAGAGGVALGYPAADPAVGLIIALVIARIGVQTGKSMLVRLMDAIPPAVVRKVEERASAVPGVLHVGDVRARYVGRELRVDLTVEVKPSITVLEGHEIAVQVQHALSGEFPQLVSPNIHVDPEGHRGEAHHFEAHHRPGDRNRGTNRDARG